MTGAGQGCVVCNDTGIITDTTDGEWACYACRAASEITYSYSRQDVESLCAIAVTAAHAALLREVEEWKRHLRNVLACGDGDPRFEACYSVKDARAALSPASGGV